jgi:2-methylcitrate dehydratase PrpD
LVASTSYDDLPDEAVHAARRAVLDYVGATLRGSQEETAQIARRAVARAYPGDGALCFPGDQTASPAGAALANGIAAHMIEFDDVHPGATLHTASAVLPAILAAAERENADGRSLLRATVLGYEAGIRIAEAVNPMHYRFWHPSGTCGTFGAAVGVAAILGLDAARVADALGSAGTQAAGLWAFMAEGAMSKHLHAGRAAENGLAAAYLAAEGFTGAHAILESPKGFIAAMAEGADPAAIVANWGRPYGITQNWFKVYPSCGHTHTAVDLALALREEVPVDQIRSVRAGVYQASADVARFRHPENAFQGRFSVAYCVASALRDGELTLASFEPERLADPELNALIDKITVEVDPEINAGYPANYGAKLEIETVDGAWFGRQADNAASILPNSVSDEELLAKFHGLAGEVLGLERARELGERIWTLPEGDTRGILGVIRG